jgi:hypothetical protein
MPAEQVQRSIKALMILNLVLQCVAYLDSILVSCMCSIGEGHQFDSMALSKSACIPQNCQRSLSAPRLRGGQDDPKDVVHFMLDGTDIYLPITEVNLPFQDAPTPLFAAAAEGEVVGLEALLAAGASLHVTDGDGDTAVTVAAFNGRDRAIACLVAHGASVATRNRFGCTPLHAAAAGGWVDAARELVRLGADRGAKDRTGLTARDMAAGCGHDGELLHVLEASGGDGCA